MLKITVTETQAGERWILQGRLVEQWVGELRTTWKRQHRRDVARVCVVDLIDVTFIDKGGERLLRAMSKEGVQFVASGVYTRHIIEQLKTQGRSRLFNPLAGLLAGFVAIVISVFPFHTGDCRSGQSERARYRDPAACSIWPRGFHQRRSTDLE